MVEKNLSSWEFKKDVTRFIVMIVSQCIQTANHVVHLKLIQCYVNYISKKQKTKPGGRLDLANEP